MPLWDGKLYELAMTAREPARAAAHWGRLLGAEVDESCLTLGGGTRIELVEGPSEGLAEERFQADAELVDAAMSVGGAVAESGEVTLTDPDGWALKLTPVREVQPLTLDGPTLSHCTLASPSPPRQRAYYERLLFRLSDQLGDIFCWLRPNPIHHSLAFSAGEQASIHHIAVELPDRASFIGAIDRVVAAGAKLEFGPGRHLVGGNLFAYFRDQYGLRWELCAEMGRLEPDQPPGLLSADDRARSVNTYGPPPPPSFIREPGGPPPTALPR